jgi:hypothetical protein
LKAKSKVKGASLHKGIAGLSVGGPVHGAAGSGVGGRLRLPRVRIFSVSCFDVWVLLFGWVYAVGGCSMGV